jgi:hypothetical protein
VEDEELKEDSRMADTPLIEYRLEARQVYGQRVFPDGRVEEWDVPADDEDGDPAWRPLTHLSADELARLEAGLHASDFFDLPARLDPPSPVRDGMSTTWQASRDGHTHTVHAHGAWLDTFPTLQRLNDLLQLLVGQALNRAADAS